MREKRVKDLEKWENKNKNANENENEKQNRERQFQFSRNNYNHPTTNPLFGFFYIIIFLFSDFEPLREGKSHFQWG